MAREKLNSFKDLGKLLVTDNVIPMPPPKPAKNKVKKEQKKKDNVIPFPVGKKPAKKKTKHKFKDLRSYQYDISYKTLETTYCKGSMSLGNRPPAGGVDIGAFKNELMCHGLELHGYEVRVIPSIITELNCNQHSTHMLELIHQYQKRFDQFYKK